VQTQLEPARPPAESASIPAVSVAGVSRAYRDRSGARVQALADISLHAAAEELLAVVGPSGCGKTTLLELICGLQAPDSGSIECAPAALMPQHDLLLPWLSALDNAALALRIAHVPRARARGRAAELFAQLGLEGFEQARPHQLSGGLRQRAMIAMALAGGPRLLIADEPTTALDVTVQKQILDLLDRLRRELQLGLLFITHDLGVVAQVADRVAVMYAGRIVEEGPALDVLRAPRHPYTQGLLAASPTLERGKLRPIPGTVPQLTALPPGCAFEPRCALRVAECVRAVPDLRVPQRAASQNHAARCILV